MSSDNTITTSDRTNIPITFDGTLVTTLDSFYDALEKGDYFEAAKAIGVLEFIGQSDIYFFEGMMYQKMALELMGHSMEAYYVIEDPRVGEYLEKVIEYFSGVPEASGFYPPSVAGIETAYRVLGRYKELDKLLGSGIFALSPIEELSRRIECLESLALIKPMEHEAWPPSVSSRKVSHVGEAPLESIARFQVFDSFANALTMAAECILQCAVYRKNQPECGTDFASLQETALFASLYEKQLSVLRCSYSIDKSLLPSNIASLPQLALDNLSWEQKIYKCESDRWKADLANTCQLLCAPENHPSVDPYQCVESMLRNSICLAQYDLRPIVEKYYTVIVGEAQQGNPSAQGYLGFTYSMMQANGEGTSELAKKLSPYAGDRSEGLFDLMFDQAELSTLMTKRGFDALNNAECAMALYEGAKLTQRDASHIALMYFRVLEIEYNANLIMPLIENIDYEQLVETTSYVERKQRRRNLDVINPQYKKWHKDLDIIYQVKSGSKPSMEIGTIRVLLDHILNRSDSCARLLNSVLEDVLTEQGIDAYRSGKMTSVVSWANVNAYRNPGAHTGFVSFTKAQEAREFVRSWIPTVESWFKAAERGE